MSDANASNSKITVVAILLGLSWAIGLCTIASAQGPTCTAPPIDRTRSLVVTDAALNKICFFQNDRRDFGQPQHSEDSREPRKFCQITPDILSG